MLLEHLALAHAAHLDAVKVAHALQMKIGFFSVKD